MFAFAGLAIITFLPYFAAAFGYLPLTQNLKIASLSLDAGLLFSSLGIATGGVALWQHRASRLQVGVCAVTGVFLILLSALALYSTRYI
jgi:hypothetical protein